MRMPKTEDHGVKRLPLQPVGFRGSVYGIAEKRMSDVTQMHTDLMGASVSSSHSMYVALGKRSRTR